MTGVYKQYSMIFQLSFILWASEHRLFNKKCYNGHPSRVQQSFTCVEEVPGVGYDAWSPTRARPPRTQTADINFKSAVAS